MKKIGLVLLIILLAGMATSFTVNNVVFPIGTVVNQTQLDSANFDTARFGFDFNRIGFNSQRDYAFFYFDYNGIEKMGSEYKIIPKGIRIKYEFVYWRACRDVNARGICVSIVKENVINDLRENKKRLILKYKDWQSKNIVSPFIKDEFDFDNLEQ